MPITVQWSWCNNREFDCFIKKNSNNIFSLFYYLSKKIKLSWSICYQKRPHPYFVLTIFRWFAFILSHIFSIIIVWPCSDLLDGRGRKREKEMRPVDFQNGEVIVMEMWREPVKRGLCFSWRPTNNWSRENRGRGAAAKTVGILSTQDMYAEADL